MNLLARPLTDLSFVVVDVETTGFSTKSDRIVEVAIAQLRGGRLDGLLIDSLVDPQRDVGPTHIHGVTAEMVQGAPKFAQLAPGVAAALRRGIVIGHNLSFDLRFLDAEATSAGVGPLTDLPRICTLSLARRLFRREFDSYKLEALCARFGLTNERAHSAAGDALVTAQLWALLLAEATRQGVRTLGDLVHTAGGWDVPSDHELPVVPQLPRARAVGALPERRGSCISQQRVADLLAIPRAERRALCRPPRRLEASKSSELRVVGAGRSVCMTGAFAGPRGGGLRREEVKAYAEKAGFRVCESVTKKLDLLVVADPNTASGKAKKARKYGIEIVAEPVFWREVGLA